MSRLRTLTAASTKLGLDFGIGAIIRAFSSEVLVSRCRTLFLALLCCLPVTDLCAQAPPRRPSIDPAPRLYAVRGTLRLAADESSVSNIKVELRRFSGEIIGIVFTRANGEFEFAGVSSGEYILQVDEDGFEPVRENVEVFQSSRIGIQLHLKKPLRLGDQPYGLAVSARELALSKKARDALRKGRQQLFDRKDPSGSVAHFRRALSEAPEHYEAMHLLALAYMDLSRWAEAEESLRECIAASQGRYAEAHFALAAVLSTNQRFTDAESSARAGIALDSSTWQGPFELARALFGTNHLQEAENQLQLVRERNPQFSSMYLLSANINLRQRDMPAVLRDLDAYLRLEPTGAMSDQARQMREAIQKSQGQAQAAPPKR